MDNQTKQVYVYMQENGSIDALRAFTDLDILRLGARIYDLKASGVSVIGEMKYKVNKSGKIEKKWKEYRLGKK